MIDLIMPGISLLMPNYRSRHKAQSLKAFGTALESGVTLEKAFYTAACEATWKPYKYVFLRAFQLVRDGTAHDEIFTSGIFNIFPTRIKAGLSSSFLTLSEKGSYVSAMSDTEAVYDYQGRSDISVYIFSIQLALACFIPPFFFMFIFPQFREILMD